MGVRLFRYGCGGHGVLRMPEAPSVLPVETTTASEA